MIAWSRAKGENDFEKRADAQILFFALLAEELSNSNGMKFDGPALWRGRGQIAEVWQEYF